LKAILLILICFIYLFPFYVVRLQADKPVGLFVIIVNDKRGYIDRNGRIVIEPQFDGATSFSEGLAVIATSENGYAEGYIDSTGVIVIRPQFDKATEFSEGLALVGFDQSKKEIKIGNKTYITRSSHPSYRWGYIDRTGQYVASPFYPNALGFSEGLAAVCLPEGKWGYIDKSGRIAIKPQFQSASSFSEGLACIMLNDKYGFIDRTGKVVIDPQFTSPGSFSEGLAPVRMGGKALNPGFNMIIGPLGGRYVYIDKKGKERITLGTEVEAVAPFSEGLAAVELEGYWGFIDKTGKMVIAPNFGGQPVFSEGLASVIIKGGGGFGFIDKTGVVVLKPSFALADNFRDGLAFVHDSLDPADAKYGYIDKSGKTIWQPSK
jgi:WG containing repeat